MVTDYTALKNAVIAKCAVSGDADFAAAFDTWVRLLEAALNTGLDQLVDSSGKIARPKLPPLRAQENLETTTLTIASSSATVPSDFLEAKRLSSPSTAVDAMIYVAPAEFYEYAKYLGSRPTNYYTREGNTFKFIGGNGSNLSLLYYGNVPPLTLSGTNATTIMTRYPMIYYHGLLSYGWSWMGNKAEDLSEFATFVSTVISANALDKKPSGGVVYSSPGFYMP
jgi:hypothetical protein